MKRTKYLIYFTLSLFFAFLTFQSFLMFRAGAAFSAPMTGVNIIGIMILWFLSYTAKSNFIKRNRIPLIVIPAIAIHSLNIPVFISTPGADLTGLALYIVASSGLLYFSYRVSRVEKQFVSL